MLVHRTVPLDRGGQAEALLLEVLLFDVHQRRNAHQRVVEATRRGVTRRIQRRIGGRIRA
jgi:hypothetical protein